MTEPHVHDQAHEQEQAVEPRRGVMGILNKVLSFPLVVLVVVYRKLISPLLPPSCRFYPSCSQYAITALQRFGPIKGTWLTIRRLGRCNPWNPGGVDHVPERRAKHTAGVPHTS